MIQQGGFVHRAGVVVEAPGNGQVDGEVFLRHAEGGEVLHHGFQLRQTLVKDLVPACIVLQRGDDLGVIAGDSDELQNLRRLLIGQTHVVHQEGAHLLRADLVQLVHRCAYVAGLLGETLHGVKAVEDAAVVDADLESLQSQLGKGLVDNGGDLRLVGDIQLAIADHVDIGLIELPEAATLGTLAAVDLADLIAAEGEAQLIVVQRHVLGQRHRQVEPQGQVGVALGEAVNLFLRLAAALGQQHFAGLDQRGVQRGKAVQAVGLAENVHHPLHLLLGSRQQLHKPG